MYRKNHDGEVILFGDSLEDTHMADNEDPERVLRIGFYNPDTESGIDKFTEVSDVVIESGTTDGWYLDTLKRAIR